MTVASQVNINRAKSIMGWMSEKELTWLANRAMEFPTIVEFGSFHGRSTRALADHTAGVIYAVDPWNGDYIYEKTGQTLKGINTFVLPEFCFNLKDHIDSGRVFICRGYSDVFTLPEGVKADMVFIDGDHGYNACKKDILKALSLLNPDGLICGHDYNHPNYPGVTQAVHELLGDVQVEDTIWWKLRS